jgi:hypothetical protein
MIKVELVLRDQEYDGEIPTVVVEALISHLRDAADSVAVSVEDVLVTRGVLRIQ